MTQVPSTQTAIFLEKISQPLAKREVPVLQPSAEEALVKISSTGLAPLDYKFRDDGVLGASALVPCVLGVEIAGTVLAYGPDVIQSDFPPIGSRVLFQGTPVKPMYGGLEEYALTNPAHLVRVPDNITLAQAATMGLNPFTGAVALFSPLVGCSIPFPGTEEASKFDYAATTVVVVGAGTSIGKFIVQLAKIAGIGQIITVSSSSSIEELRSYGATNAIDRKGEHVAEEIKSQAGGDIETVIDCYNAKYPQLAVSVIGPKGGRVVSLLNVGARVEDGSAEAQELKARNVNITAVHGSFAHRGEVFQYWPAALTKWLSEGKIVPPQFKLVQGLDAGGINAALDDIRTEASGVKYVVQVDKDAV
ncbi:hypothetical protein G7046_g3677 [Stylonectria norvegica]|nr:hypothetical protein G7046_g3677 [Stylonectria norvegica]